MFLYLIRINPMRPIFLLLYRENVYPVIEGWNIFNSDPLKLYYHDAVEDRWEERKKWKSSLSYHDRNLPWYFHLIKYSKRNAHHKLLPTSKPVTTRRRPLTVGFPIR